MNAFFRHGGDEDIWRTVVPFDLQFSFYQEMVLLSTQNDIGISAISNFKKFYAYLYGHFLNQNCQSHKKAPLDLTILKEETFAGRNFRGSGKPPNIYISRK